MPGRRIWRGFCRVGIAMLTCASCPPRFRSRERNGSALGKRRERAIALAARVEPPRAGEQPEDGGPEVAVEVVAAAVAEAEGVAGVDGWIPGLLGTRSSRLPSPRACAEEGEAGAARAGVAAAEVA